MPDSHPRPNAVGRFTTTIERHFAGLVKAALALAVVVTLATGFAHAAPQPSARVCFPASKWDAKDSKRPCARVVRVEEDGSVRVKVADADGAYRYSATVGAEDR